MRGRDRVHSLWVSLGISPSLFSLFPLLDVDAAGAAPGPLLCTPALRRGCLHLGSGWALKPPHPPCCIYNAVCVPARSTLWDFSRKGVPDGSGSSFLPRP